MTIKNFWTTFMALLFLSLNAQASSGSGECSTDKYKDMLFEAQRAQDNLKLNSDDKETLGNLYEKRNEILATSVLLNGIKSLIEKNQKELASLIDEAKSANENKNPLLAISGVENKLDQYENSYAALIAIDEMLANNGSPLGIYLNNQEQNPEELVDTVFENCSGTLFGEDGSTEIYSEIKNEVQAVCDLFDRSQKNSEENKESLDLRKMMTNFINVRRTLDRSEDDSEVLTEVRSFLKANVPEDFFVNQGKHIDNIQSLRQGLKTYREGIENESSDLKGLREKVAKFTDPLKSKVIGKVLSEDPEIQGLVKALSSDDIETYESKFREAQKRSLASMENLRGLLEKKLFGEEGLVSKDKQDFFTNVSGMKPDLREAFVLEKLKEALNGVDFQCDQNELMSCLASLAASGQLEQKKKEHKEKLDAVQAKIKAIEEKPMFQDIETLKGHALYQAQRVCPKLQEECQGLSIDGVRIQRLVKNQGQVATSLLNIQAYNINNKDKRDSMHELCNKNFDGVVLKTKMKKLCGDISVEHDRMAKLQKENESFKKSAKRYGISETLANGDRWHFERKKAPHYIANSLMEIAPNWLNFGLNPHDGYMVTNTRIDNAYDWAIAQKTFQVHTQQYWDNFDWTTWNNFFSVPQNGYYFEGFNSVPQVPNSFALVG